MEGKLIVKASGLPYEKTEDTGRQGEIKKEFDRTRLGIRDNILTQLGWEKRNLCLMFPVNDETNSNKVMIEIIDRENEFSDDVLREVQSRTAELLQEHFPGVEII